MTIGKFAQAYAAQNNLLSGDGSDTAKKRNSKYGAKKTSIGGVVFDSRAESLFYERLLILQKARKIKSITLQPRFILQDGFTDCYGFTHQPIYYISDFEVVFADDRVKVFDVKGNKTKEYQIKKKLFLFRYPHVSFEEVYLPSEHPIGPEKVGVDTLKQLKREAALRSKRFAMRSGINTQKQTPSAKGQ